MMDLCCSFSNLMYIIPSIKLVRVSSTPKQVRPWCGDILVNLENFRQLLATSSYGLYVTSLCGWFSAIPEMVRWAIFVNLNVIYISVFALICLYKAFTGFRSACSLNQAWVFGSVPHGKANLSVVLSQPNYSSLLSFTHFAQSTSLCGLWGCDITLRGW